MILFLDFDGVLHPQYENQPVPVDVAFCHLTRFEQVMREFPDVEIIVSSTWREQFSLDKLRGWFSADIASRIVDTTPILQTGEMPVLEQREAEILQWLTFNDRLAEPWLALDDQCWQFKRYRDRVVNCVVYVGLDDRAAMNLKLALEALWCCPDWRRVLHLNRCPTVNFRIVEFLQIFQILPTPPSGNPRQYWVSRPHAPQTQ